MIRTAPWGGVLVAVLIVVSGCTGGTTVGTATTPSSTGLAPVEQVAFDPCAISDEVLVELQLVPSTRTAVLPNAPQGVETGCGWSNATINSTVSLDAGRSTRTLQDYLDNTAFDDVAATTVGSHQAVQFVIGGVDPDETWSMALGVPNGVVVLTATSAPSGAPSRTPRQS